MAALLASFGLTHTYWLVTTQELDEIETSLGVVLPRNYREWALRLPKVDEETKSWHWIFTGIP